jgi:hypothetical protein
VWHIDAAFQAASASMGHKERNRLLPPDIAVSVRGYRDEQSDQKVPAMTGEEVGSTFGESDMLMD